VKLIWNLKKGTKLINEIQIPLPTEFRKSEVVAITKYTGR